MGFVGGGVAVLTLPYWRDEIRLPLSEQAASVTEKQSIVSEDSAVADMVQRTSPGVVSVVISKDVSRLRGFSGNPFFGFPFFADPFDDSGRGGSGETRRQTVGQGSGFLVSSDGMIVTNKHVVQDGNADYTVIANDGKEYPAKVLASDPTNDIALIKIDAQGLHALDLGNSDDLKVGQTVIAIGNSLGEFSNTVSKGIVSGLRRDVVAGSDQGGAERLRDIIQTDAAINPGNSGGPLLDVSGSVIGVNVAMAQGAENIGFALPINQVKRIIDQVKTTGKIATPFLGVRYMVLDKDIQKQENLPFGYGALILRGERMTDFAVIPGSPADKAGLVENDIILEIDGVKVDKDRQIGDVVAEHQAGDELTLKVWHKGETKDVRVKLEERK
jgi:serine protease Do